MKLNKITFDNYKNLSREYSFEQANKVTIRTIAYCRVGKKAVPLQPIYKPY